MIIEIKELIFRKRKGFCLRIDQNGDLIVIAPYFATEAEIKRVVQKKLNWIVKTRQVVIHNNQKTKPLNFEKGETLLFLGDWFLIDFHDKSDIFIDFASKVIYFPKGDKSTLKRKLMQFYFNKAYEVLKEKLDHWADVMGLQYKILRLKNAQKLWGSCGKNGTINLNWRLILFPKELIEHIIIHELAHLVHKNHSKQFKFFVSQFSKNYSEKEKWLRENSFILQMYRE